MQTINILVIDDESAIRKMIRMALELESFTCLEAASANEAAEQLKKMKPHLAIVDWMMPGMSGINYIHLLRQDPLTKNLPILMLTAKSEESDLVKALNIGADDYMYKPFSPREMIARIKALLRRSGALSSNRVIRFKTIALDDDKHQLCIDDQVVGIGPLEYKLLLLFLSRPDTAFSRETIINAVWGHHIYIEERTVDVHIRRLRKTLSKPDANNNYANAIETVRGIGYRWNTSV